MKLKMLSDFNLFGRAYRATSHEIWVSVKLLVIVTVCFAVVLFLAESTTNDGYTFWDALVWTFVKYVEDPADIVSAPVTVVGKVVGTLVGVLGIAIFAVPAGLIGSGLMEAMGEEKHEKEIGEYHKRLLKAFRRAGDKSLRSYLNRLPDKGGEALAKLNFVPRHIPLARLQIRQGMEMKEVYEVCERFPELSLKNMADACSDEETVEDRFVVELSPMNASYGCCIDRQSKVTIVCPTGYSEVGIGWFTYYLAKLGGFNYVCKSVEVDTDELDSFYNLSPEPLFDKKERAEYTSKDREAMSVLDKKERLRKDFLSDIKRIANGGDDSWVIVMAEHQKNTENLIDFHFADNRKDGSQAAVMDKQRYEVLYQEFASVMEREFSLSATPQSARYPLMKSNLAYRIKQEGIACNAFVLRPSSHLMNFDTRRMVVALRMAQVISQQLDDDKGINEADVKDFATTGFGYKE